jgi:hypothetical protein
MDRLSLSTRANLDLIRHSSIPMKPQALFQRIVLAALLLTFALAGPASAATTTWTNTSDLDYATIKYSSVGVPVWTNRYNGSGNFWDWSHSVAVDDLGNCYVTGQSVTSGGYDYATIKYAVGSAPAAIPLSLAQTGGRIVLSWSNTAFSLQSAPALGSTFTNIPGATSPYSNDTAGPQQFFRLIGN